MAASKGRFGARREGPRIFNIKGKRSLDAQAKRMSVCVCVCVRSIHSQASMKALRGAHLTK